MAESHAPAGSAAGENSADHGADDRDAAQALDAQVSEWLDLDPEEFPFIRLIVGEFREHDDRTLFLDGLDLLLGGIERQTWP